MDLQNKKWSFSSVKLFETCPFAFKLKYIDGVEEQLNAFAQHGSYVHSLLERYFKGELYAFELADEFEAHYDENVTEKFPFFNMFNAFFSKTLNYLQKFDGIDGEIVAVEQKFDTVIGGHKFIGYADLILRDDEGLVVVDHKSHGAWKSKKERTDYMRQLYLDAYCVKGMYGEFPHKLVFNMFRKDEPLDEEVFKEGDCMAAIDWFKGAVDVILANEDWECKVDDWYCGQLCGCECVWRGE